MATEGQDNADGQRSFGTLLRAHRVAAGLTQAALAERAGVSTRAIQDLERGLSQPHRDTLMRLVEALSVPPDQQAEFRDVARASPRMRTPTAAQPPNEAGSPAITQPAPSANQPGGPTT